MRDVIVVAALLRNESLPSGSARVALFNFSKAEWTATQLNISFARSSGRLCCLDFGLTLLLW